GGAEMSARVLIAGVGNIFFGDDGFAAEVARRLASSPAPPGLAIADFGTGTLHLAYALLEGPELAVIIDALPRGGAPGTLYLLEPEIDALAAGAPAGHELSLPAALALLETMGGTPPPVVI